MQFFSSERRWSHSKPPQLAAGCPRSGVVACNPESYGWFDSSLDLAQGLEVMEQDDDALYQLWELSRR